MTPKQILELAKERQLRISKIQHYLDQGLSYTEIGEKFTPIMCKQAVMYYIRRYEINKKPIKEFNN